MPRPGTVDAVRTGRLRARERVAEPRRRRRTRGGVDMPVWTVQLPDGEDEQVEAGVLATQSGPPLPFSDEGGLLSAWAPGQWRTRRWPAAHPPPRPGGGVGGGAQTRGGSPPR